MEQNTGIQFKIYLMAESRPGLEEGWIRIWSNKGERFQGAKNVAFDWLDQVPGKLKAELVTYGIEWPKKRKQP